MRPKLTWRVRRWSEGSLVEQLPAFRLAHGAEAAQVVEDFRSAAADHRDQPSAQDRKSTLRALADFPTTADLTRLDGLTFALVLKHSWLRYRVQHLERLQPDQLAACARAALLDVPSIPGKPRTDPLAELLVHRLLQILPDSATTGERDVLLTDALLACGFGATPENLRRLLVRRGRFSNLRR